MKARTEDLRVPYGLVIVLASILLLSILFIHSASYDSKSSTYRDYSRKQLDWMLVGFAFFLAILPVKTRLFKEWAWFIYAGALVLLVLVFAIGDVHKGARRWISFGSINVQPSELMKIAVILVVARFLANREMASEGWKNLAVPLAAMCVPLLLILKQPDLGTSIIFVPVVFSMLWVSGVKKRYLAALVGIGLILVPIGWCFVLKDYQKGRLLVFLSPSDPTLILKLFVPPERLKRMRKVDGYHVNQSMIAVGSGGLAGKGWGMGTQNTLGYLPERHTDFIFCVVAEEWGFIGAFALLILYFLLFLFAFEIALDAPDPFGKYVAIGVVVLLFVHVSVNTAMTIGFAPITGLTLPFLSYGGSSTVTFFIATGLLANIHRHRERKELGIGN